MAILAGALVFKANQESGGKELGSGVLKGPACGEFPGPGGPCGGPGGALASPKARPAASCPGGGGPGGARGGALGGALATYGSYNVDITNWENPRFFMGKSTISTGPWLQ